MKVLTGSKAQKTEPKTKIVPFRESLPELIKLISSTPTRGVIGIAVFPDGHARFHISGFTGALDEFVISGLLDWIKSDLLSGL